MEASRSRSFHSGLSVWRRQFCRRRPRIFAEDRTIADVSADLDAFRFNRAVARIRELTNEVSALAGDEPSKIWAHAAGFEAIVQLIGPVMPHLAEELWVLLELSLARGSGLADSRGAVLGGRHGDHCRAGKREAARHHEMSPSTSKDEAEAMASRSRMFNARPKVRRPTKVIVVPNKVINVVL